MSSPGLPPWCTHPWRPGPPQLAHPSWVPRYAMPAWVVLPITLPAFTITGMWIVYAMALSNNHICPVTNWIYNQSCEFDESSDCCSLDHIPLVRNPSNYSSPNHLDDHKVKKGSTSVIAYAGWRDSRIRNEDYKTQHALRGRRKILDDLLDDVRELESGIRELNERIQGDVPAQSVHSGGIHVKTLATAVVMIVGLLRYAHVIEHYGPSLLNTVSFALGWICAAGLTMVGNFQVNHAKVLHYIGAGVAFPTSMLFICLQSLLTYRMAHTRSHYWMGHLRSLLTSLGLVTLVLSGVFFIQESVVLQHVAALCEWIFIINVLIFYGTFAFEFGAITTETFLVLLKASRAPKSYKMDSSTATTPRGHSTSENLAMI